MTLIKVGLCVIDVHVHDDEWKPMDSVIQGPLITDCFKVSNITI